VQALRRALRLAPSQGNLRESRGVSCATSSRISGQKQGKTGRKA
jgi:hypothetical protein